ncbi:hypothetical protein KQI42_20320 [Tissierella sp. MSJ-40]|uniref:Uncharacterized protein n=1 Tax=Tissierella simiarum TaxID=2841534 RepID=A0ABS6EBP9_9FIRM|nr:hypothetical protein [Tissierella simiarum]MBU5440345.1 hypothetical protein [Tissierella simiarum]
MKDDKLIKKWEKQRRLGWFSYSLIVAVVRTGASAIIMMGANMVLRGVLYAHPVFTYGLIGIAVGSFFNGKDIYKRNEDRYKELTENK